MPIKVLLDTSALCALAAPDDQFNAQAIPLYQGLIRRQEELYITSYILLETSATVHRRFGFTTLRKLIEEITPVAKVYWIDHALHQQAWNSLISRNGAGPGLVDWTTILVARNLGSIVFTFDKHFKAEGLSVLPRRL